MRLFKAMLIAAAVLLIIGCSNSQNSPTIPASSNSFADLAAIIDGNAIGDFTPEDQGWQVGFQGELVPDGSGGFTIVEDRDALVNLDATSYLLGIGAFSFQIINVNGNLFQIEVTIENPVSAMIFDVRLIFNRIGANIIKNPDSYTTLFSSGISPYISFGTDDPNRMFPVGPGGTDTQDLFLEFNGSSVGFTIAVSIPIFCDEPYEIYNLNLIGLLNDEDGGWATLSCIVADHMWDLEFVVADLRQFTGNIMYMASNPEKPDNFEVYFSNDLLTIGGISYPTWIAAKSVPSPILCYNLIQIPVEGGYDPPIVTITVPAVDPFETSEHFTTVAGTIDNFDGDEATMDINGDQQTIAVTNNTFEDVAILSDGENLVIISAEGPGGIGTDSVVINSTAPQTNIWIRLIWDQDNTDVDLYTTEPGGFTCWYADKLSPNTGAQLDVDDVTGYGPEHYYISELEGHILEYGLYEIDVHYYSDHGTGLAVVAEILVYKDDSYYGEWSQIMSVSNPWDNGPENRRTGKSSWWDNVVDIDY